MEPEGAWGWRKVEGGGGERLGKKRGKDRRRKFFVVRHETNGELKGGPLPALTTPSGECTAVARHPRFLGRGEV